jgi:hypothetical protein
MRRAPGVDQRPGWALANAVLVIAQGLLPLAGLYLIRQIVDAVTAGLVNPDKAAAFPDVLIWRDSNPRPLHQCD